MRGAACHEIIRPSVPAKVGHFTALVGVDGELRHLPLVDEHGENFPIRCGRS